MEENEIYSYKLIKGNRTYFFDIKKSAQGDLYFKVSESKKTENGFERHGIVVFEENIKDFVEGFIKLLTKLTELKEPKPIDGKAYSVEKIRKFNKKAYYPWTIEDDQKLELLFTEGKKVKELAQIFERNAGAISSRIKKLGLK